jgi:hypothetical protein
VRTLHGVFRALHERDPARDPGRDPGRI